MVEYWLLQHRKQNPLILWISDIQFNIYRGYCATVDNPELCRRLETALGLINANIILELYATLIADLDDMSLESRSEGFFIPSLKQGKIEIVGKAIVFDKYFPYARSAFKRHLYRVQICKQPVLSIITFNGRGWYIEFSCLFFDFSNGDHSRSPKSIVIQVNNKTPF